MSGSSRWALLAQTASGFSLDRRRVPEEFIDPHGSAWNWSVAMLRVSYRFAGDSGIGALSESINQGALSPDWLNPIQAGRWADLTPIPASPRLTQDAGLKNLVLTEYQAYLNQVHQASNDSQRLQAIDSFQRFQFFVQLAKANGAQTRSISKLSPAAEAGFIHLMDSFMPPAHQVTQNDKTWAIQW